MDDPLLVRVLNGLAHGNDQLQPLTDREVIVVAVPGDGYAMHELHDEERAPAVGRAGVKDLGNVRVVHHGQGLLLGREAGDDLGAVHSRLDDLESDPTMDRLVLLGHVDDAVAAFAELLEQLVRADRDPRPLGSGMRRSDGAGRDFQQPVSAGGGGEEATNFGRALVVGPLGRAGLGRQGGPLRLRRERVAARLLVAGEEPADLGPQILVAAAGAPEPGIPRGGVELACRR